MILKFNAHRLTLHRFIVSSFHRFTIHTHTENHPMSANPRISTTDWQGKSIWLIGASTGIGEALARDLTALGANIILTARSADALHTLSAQLPHSTALPADFTDAAAVATAWQAACAAAKGARQPAPFPSMVIINAGSYETMPAKHFDLTRAQRQMAVNVGGPLTVLGQILPTYTAAKAGHIVLVSSVAGYRALPKAMVYGASKAALSYIGETLYLEIGHRGTAVSVVHPGFVTTPLTAGNDYYMPGLQTAQQASARIISGLQAGRLDIHFPKRLSWFLKLLRVLPRPLYMALLRKTL
jgi:short-subunit dehydrogenase